MNVADFADRIGQRGDLFDTFGHAVDTLFGQGKTVEHGAFESGGAGGGQIFLVGGDQRGLVATDGGGDGEQRGILLGGRSRGEAARGNPGLTADGLHVVLDVHDVPDSA